MTENKPTGQHRHCESEQGCPQGQDSSGNASSYVLQSLEPSVERSSHGQSILHPAPKLQQLSSTTSCNNDQGVNHFDQDQSQQQPRSQPSSLLTRDFGNANNTESYPSPISLYDTSCGSDVAPTTRQSLDEGYTPRESNSNLSTLFSPTNPNPSAANADLHVRDSVGDLDSNIPAPSNGRGLLTSPSQAPKSSTTIAPALLRENERRKRQFKGFLSVDEKLPGHPSAWEIVRSFPNHLTDQVYRELIYKYHATAILVYEQLDPKAKEQCPAIQGSGRFQKIISKIRKEDGRQTKASIERSKLQAALRAAKLGSQSLKTEDDETRNGSIVPHEQQAHPQPQGSAAAFPPNSTIGVAPRPHAEEKQKDRVGDDDNGSEVKLAQKQHGPEPNTTGQASIADVSTDIAPTPSSETHDQSNSMQMPVEGPDIVPDENSHGESAVLDAIEELFGDHPLKLQADQIPLSDNFYDSLFPLDPDPSGAPLGAGSVENGTPNPGAKRTFSDENGDDESKCSQPAVKQARVESQADTDNGASLAPAISQPAYNDFGAQNNAYPPDNDEIMNDFDLELALNADFYRFFNYETYR